MEKNVQNLFSFGNPLFFGVFNVKIRGVLVVCPFERLQVSQKKRYEVCFSQLSTLKISGAMSLVFMGAFLHA